METFAYRPSLQEGTRVVLVHERHPQHQEAGTVVAVLPNPSSLSAHQWYDIRFDNGTWGRFLEHHLQTAPPAEAEPAGVESQGHEPSAA